MDIRTKLRAGGSKAVRAVMSGVLAIGLMPLPAFADDLTAATLSPQADPTAMSADGGIIAAAYAAANPAPELLGLNNPNQRSEQEAEQTYAFFGDSEINENPDPYLYNQHNKLTPGVTIGGRGGSPMSALNDYDTKDATAAQNAVWKLKPHIILGTGSDTIPENEHAYYDTDANARTVEKELGEEPNSYHPIGVTYNRVSLPTMIQTMYRLAKAANAVKTDNDKVNWRYDDPMEIAKDYERYVVGQKGVVKQAIDTGKVKEKTIALVQSYDSDAKTYTIITDGIAEGTATTNRYLEAVQGVTKNYYDTVGATGATAVKADDLKSNVDAIILGGQASTESGTLADYLAKDNLLDRTYYCTNWANGSAFGTTVNSVENAQNVGRILPFVYPEVLDQSDMIYYYYDVFYHLKDGAIADVIDERMDGVRNAAATDSAAYTNWAKTDVAGYDHDKVEAQLTAGIGYLNSVSGLSDYLTPSEYLADDKLEVDLANATVTVSASVLKDGKAEPEPTVTYGATTLKKDTDYTVTYSDNTEEGKTATVTVTAKEGSNVKNSATASFKVITEADITAFEGFTATLPAESYAYTSKAVEPTVTLKNGEKELKEGTDFVVSYSNNVSVAAANAEKAPTATITGISDYAGTITKTFAITKAAPKGTIVTDKTEYAYGEAFSISTSVDSVYTNDGGKALTIASDNDKVIKEVEETVRGQKSKSWKIVGPGEATLTATADATANCDAPVVAPVKITVTAVDISKYDSQLKKLDVDWGYTGDDITNINGNISLADDNKNTLKENTDYKVTFTRTADGEGKTVADAAAAAAPKELGAYKMTVAGMGGYTGSFDFTVNVVPFLKVYKQIGEADPVLAYTFNSKADFEALVDAADTDPVSALYYKGGWNVSTAKKYVKLDAVIEKAGLTASWIDDAKINYGGDARQGKAANTFTKAQLDALNFYPNAEAETMSAEGAVKAPFVFALEEYASAIGEGKKASDAQAANLEKANTSTAPRSVLGVNAADYAAKEGTTAAGKRLWNNITSITIISTKDSTDDKTGTNTGTGTGTGTGDNTGTGTTTGGTTGGTTTGTTTGTDPGTTAGTDTPTDASAVETGDTVEDVAAGSGTTVDVKVSSSNTVTVTSSEAKAGGTVKVNTVKVDGKTYKVTAIAASAFKGTKAKKVTVGNNVTSLGKGAFQNAKQLTALTLGKNVKTIGKNALKGASKLKTVTLKSSNLKQAAFKNLVKGSSVKTVKLSGVSAKAKKSYKKWAASLGVKVK